MVVGHVLFSGLPVLTDGGTVPALSLAPLAVLPEHQKRGVGAALVRAGLEACRDRGHRAVVVLGPPDYYPRFGFSARLAEPLASPFDARDSWMAAELVPGALDGVRGWVRYPPPFGIGVQVRPVYRPDRYEWVRMRTALWPDGGTEHGDDVAAFFASGTFRWPEAFLSWQVLVAERPAGGLCGFVEVSVRPHVDGCSTRPVGYVEGWYVDWRCLRVAGAMPFTLVGVLAALTTPVARAGVGVFAVSTFDTDYLFVKANDMPAAVAALRGAGHVVEQPGV